MKIDLTRQEVAQILKDKYGDAFFRVFYVESDKTWEERTGKRIDQLEQSPKKEIHCLIFDETPNP